MPVSDCLFVQLVYRFVQLVTIVQLHSDVVHMTV